MSLVDRISVSVREIGSESEVMDLLSRSSVPTLLLGTDAAEYVRKYYCFDVAVNGVPRVTIGLYSLYMGLEPDHMVKEGRLLVGFNFQVAIIDLGNPLAISEIPLVDALLFYDFIDLPETRDVVVIGETGIARVSVDGIVLWSVGTDDIVLTWEVIDNTVHIHLWGMSPRRYDLSGNEIHWQEWPKNA